MEDVNAGGLSGVTEGSMTRRTGQAARCFEEKEEGDREVDGSERAGGEKGRRLNSLDGVKGQVQKEDDKTERRTHPISYELKY